MQKNLLRIKGAIVDTFDFGGDAQGEPPLVVHVRVGRKGRWRCPACGRRCHDHACDEAFWRGMDFAFPAAWMVRGGLGKRKVAELMRADRDTVGRLVDLVRHGLGPDVKKRFDGLVRIGVDETGCRKGYGKEVPDLFFGEPGGERTPWREGTG